ncbi:MAG TPA: hypothetical protein VHT75_11655 [Acidimicrobiales bacterium]|nr:hypothetical protein [Acidimicrobiales bacterium]
MNVRLRQGLEVGAVVWAVIGGTVALLSLATVKSDARLVVGLASVGCPLAAASATIALSHHRERLAGFLLIVSVATPTYFAWVLNVPALVFGVMLLAMPNTLLGRPRLQHI